MNEVMGAVAGSGSVDVEWLTPQLQHCLVVWSFKHAYVKAFRGEQDSK